VFDRIKRIYWNLYLHSIGATVGKNIQLNTPYYFYIGENASITIGDNVAIAHNVTISANKNCRVTIGNNVAIGQNVSIIPSNHDLSDVAAECIPGTIQIGDNVWIGANVVILQGVVIGNGCVIGAGSVVTRSMPAGWVCCGNPCRPCREVSG
jgi:maltose O-acetyltransferase